LLSFITIHPSSSYAWLQHYGIKADSRANHHR
jgi:hypothetical protein